MSDFATAIAKLVDAVGIVAFVGLVGIYCIFCSICGRLVFIKNGPKLSSGMQKFEMLILGVILAIPLLHGIYASGITLTPQQIPHVVSDHASINIHRGAKLAGYSPQVLQAREDAQTPQFAALLVPATLAPIGPRTVTNQACRQVESFGLKETSYRRLEYRAFKDKLYVYVGNIRPNVPVLVYVFAGGPAFWPQAGTISESDLRTRLGAGSQRLATARLPVGGHVGFLYVDQDYELTMNKIYVVLFGSNQAAISVCKNAATGLMLNVI